MNIAVRYFTRTGNTKKLAMAIADAVGVVALDVSVPLLEKVDVLFLGSSMYAGGVDDAVKRFIADNRHMIGKLYSFSTAAVAQSTYKQIQKVAAGSSVALGEVEFHCRGSFAVLHRNRPNEEDCRKAAAFARQVINRV